MHGQVGYLEYLGKHLPRRGESASRNWPDQRSALAGLRWAPSKVARPSLGGNIDSVFKDAATVAAIAGESSCEFGAPVKTTHRRSILRWLRNFSPMSLASRNCVSLIISCVDRSSG